MGAIHNPNLRCSPVNSYDPPPAIIGQPTGSTAFNDCHSHHSNLAMNGGTGLGSGLGLDGDDLDMMDDSPDGEDDDKDDDDMMFEVTPLSGWHYISPPNRLIFHPY